MCTEYTWIDRVNDMPRHCRQNPIQTRQRTIAITYPISNARIFPVPYPFVCPTYLSFRISEKGSPMRSLIGISCHPLTPSTIHHLLTLITRDSLVQRFLSFTVLLPLLPLLLRTLQVAAFHSRCCRATEPQGIILEDPT
jgi:hypothetical protein